MTDLLEYRVFKYLSVQPLQQEWVVVHSINAPSQWFVYTRHGQFMPSTKDDVNRIEDEIREQFRYARPECLGYHGIDLLFRIAKKDAMVFKLQFCGEEVKA